MAIGIDNVYQQVLAIANKEQRGYITPQEFNLLARKAQLDIFEGLFHDYKTTFLTPGNNSSSGDDYEMLRDKIAVHRVHGGEVSAEGSLSSDAHWLEKVYDGNSYRTVEITFPATSGIVDNTSYLRLRAIYDGTGSKPAGEGDFEIRWNTENTPPTGLEPGDLLIETSTDSTPQTASVVTTKFIQHINDNSPYHTAALKTGTTDTVILTYKQPGITGSESQSLTTITTANASSTSDYVVYEEVNKDDWHYIQSNKKLNPTKSSRGIFYRASSIGGVNYIEILPSPGKKISCDYIKKPADPKWTYVVVGGKALYNGSDAGLQDFELHASEESTLVNKILELAGIVINKPGLSEVVLRNEEIKEANKNT